MQAKTDQFTEEQQKLSQFARVISHPARIAVIQLLAAKKACISGDISKEIPQLSRVTISQHLQELRQFGLIKGETEGVKVCYCLNYERFREFEPYFSRFFGQIDEKVSPDCC